LKTASNYPIHQSRPPIQNGAQKPNATVDVKDKLRELAMTAQTAKEKNKELVTTFYELAINQKKPTEAAGKYIGLPYTQHNPEVPRNGPEGFIQFVEGMFKKHPELTVTVHRAVADENFVALHVHLKRDERDPGIAVAEFFLVLNGKIVEHWDVMQPVPEKTASGNSMF
jgi:predicted SnoaL-like aldol condensation-catalyzing enzyme